MRPPARLRLRHHEPARSTGSASTDELRDAVRRHKAEPWIVSSGSDGDMRLVVDAHPSDWPPTVYRAAALVELLDARTLADRADAREVAVELEAVLDALRREGVRAWLTS